MFRKSFKSAKCKTLVRMAMSRIKLLRNKRDMQLKQMRRDLSLLLQSGQDPSARIRVEHIIREQNIMAAYDIIELFCELIVARLPIIVSQSKCPVDLREALSSLIFAAPRCADIPELLDIRDLFGAKYGKEFVSAAAELRPDCGVNRTIIEKLSVKTPNGEVKLKLMKEIAKEYQVDWDPAESEAEFFKRPDDLLEGPSKFVGATNISGGSKKDHSPTVFGQKGECQSPDLHQNPSRLPFSSTSALPSQSPTTSGNQQSEKLSGWPLQSTSGRTNVQPVDPCQDFSVDRTLHSSSSTKHNSFSTAGTSNTSRQQGSHDLGVIKRNISGTSTGSPGVSNEDVVLCGDRDYNMYFKDTASAAKAAADSAEKAVAASRAAAQLAKQNNLQNRHQQAFDSFDPSLSDVETTDSCNLRMNRKPYLHQTQSFHGYDPYRMARVEGHAGNKNLSRSASGQITRENEALNSDDGCEMPVKRSGRRDASHHGNAVKLYSNSTPAMHNYDTMRSERQSFGSYEDNPLKESNTPSLLPSRRTEMVYSNNLASPIFDESDCTDSESDEEIEAQHFVSETRNMPRAELSSTSQAPTRPPPGVTFSTLNNSQPSTYAGLNSRGSHVHPKLPDYDALASRFESLKYQRK